MSLPQEIVEEVFHVIEGGNVLGDPAKIIQFPSDNGQKSWNLFKQTYKGSNGTGFNYWVVAVNTLIGEVRYAVSAGAVMLTMEVGAFGLAVAPCLGILQGVLLYNIAPEFWTTLSNKLVAAGLTVKGKVVTFIDKHGVRSFPPEAIEIFKQELIDYNFFTAQGSVINPDLIQDCPEIYKEYFLRNYTLDTGNVKSVPYDFLTPDSGYVATELSKVEQTTHRVYVLTKFYPSGNNGAVSVCLISKGPFTYDGNDANLAYQVGDYTAYTYLISTNFLGGWAEPYSPVNNINVTNYTYGQIPQTPQGYAYDFFTLEAVNILYGQFPPSVLQNGATYPTNDPFPLTYPDWYPIEFPDIDGEQLPDTYPAEYPEQLPNEEPYQDPAQNPDPDSESYPDSVVEFITDPSYDPWYDPWDIPIPAPDPDPQPEPEPIPDDDTGEDEEDPIEPDPDPVPTPIIPIPPLPETVSSNKLFTVYNPSQSQLDALGAYLWDSDLMEILKKIWQNPLDGIISLMQVYATPTAGSSAHIILGYLDSEVSAPVVTNQFVTIDCGNVTLNEKNNNCTDYVPYTQVQIYMPFIGITELDTNEIMNSVINVKYKIDVYTGSCISEIKITRDGDMPNGPILYTYNGNCAQQLPLTSGDAKGLLGALIGAAGAGISIASGGEFGVMAGARMISSNIARGMLHVGHSGNLSANAGIMGQKKPYLIINREKPYTANGYNKFYGFPANKTVYLGNCTGFVRVKATRLRTAATENEKNEILELLTNGVIM